jgi:hypothetical protein
MDIQNVFFKQASLYLNSSLVVLAVAVVGFLVKLFFLSNISLLILVLPFIAYSTYLFHMYLIYQKRASLPVKINIETEEDDLLALDQLVVYFIPEERAILLFHASGKLMGKLFELKKNRNIRKLLMPKEYLLVDANNQLIATYYKSNETIEVYERARGYCGTYSYNEAQNFHMLSNDDTGILKSEAAVFDEYIKRQNNQVVFRIRKGWMPLKHQVVFHNPNLPVLTMHTQISREEKLLYCSSLITRFF